jgi:hypothetical protein
VVYEISKHDGNESIQLNEEMIVRGRRLKHFIESDGLLKKTEPIVFACLSEANEIEISMQYEGFPIDPFMVFIHEVEKKWKKENRIKTNKI